MGYVGRATLTNYTIEDTNMTALTYSGIWGNNSNALFSGGTTHYTNDSDASVSFSFHGTAFYVYGDQNNDHGPFSVEVDGVGLGEVRPPLGCGGEFRGGYCEKTDPGRLLMAYGYFSKHCCLTITSQVPTSSSQASVQTCIT